VLAGFWNCHVHFTDPRWADAAHQPAEALARELDAMLTSHGFVHVFDTGSDLENTLALRARIERDVPGPSVLTAGTPFCPRDGSPFYIAPMKLPELGTPEEAAAGVRARLGAGADAIKLFAASPAAPGKLVVMPLPIFTAAAAAAHAEHRLVLAHPTANAGVETAVAGGVDVILHTAPDGGEDWNDALVGRMRAANVALVPTLQLWEWELARKDSAPEVVDRFLALACRQLGAFARAGGEVLFGTDVGYMDDFDPSQELVLMEEAGLDWRAILAALTTAPARRFGLAEKSGRLAQGMDADVAVVDGRPDQDVRAFAQVRSSWRGGRRLHPPH
jgi:imidazolonepropionase-like amidohydrolase